MGLLDKKNNGINWQKEVFEIGKTLPSMVEKLGNIDSKFNDHMEAGRVQRKEDKIWQTKLLENSLNCSRSIQIDDIQVDVDVLKSDKKGIKMIYKFILGGLGLIILILGILWRLGLL